MKNAFKVLAVAGLLSTSALQASDAPRTPSAEGASVYIISPADGEVVGNRVTVKFGLEGMGVAPAGVEKKFTGHHHLLVNGKSLPAFDKPMGSEVKHFGGGQTQTTIELPEGKHTLQLVLGDHKHIPHEPPLVSEVITIMVR